MHKHEAQIMQQFYNVISHYVSSFNKIQTNDFTSLLSRANIDHQTFIPKYGMTLGEFYVLHLVMSKRIERRKQSYLKKKQ